MAESQELNLFVSIPMQTVQVRSGDCVSCEFPVSTSKFGLGSVEGSHCTPLGKFEVMEKMGDGLPLRAILKSRVWAGAVWDSITSPPELCEKDLILTRILWLNGLEAHNANTYFRYIYFHGTNQEQKIGSPQSDGCIRLRNEDMVKLYDLVPVKTKVEIR
ncbi:MAG: L,D-transpeptidase [Verrucomicrobiota bacterium]|nr:L,D-transpeptidase [Verrucomicrobiota bacterium]